MLRDHLERQAALTERAPTEAQKAAGNYRKGRVKAHGLEVVIENARGSTRSGKGPDGKPWKCRLPCHYGYIRRTEGADGDQVDVYVGPHLKSAKVFVLDQRDADSGAWDEHKVFFGFNSPRHVLNTYRQAFSDGKADQRLGAVTEMTVDQFKNWLKTGDTTKPMHRASGGRVARANIKLGRDAFLYLDSTSDRFAQCGTCRFGHDHCAIMNGTKVDPKNGSCGYYIKGAPIGHPIADMTKEQVGYVDHPVRCENCRYFDHGTCKLYAELNREFPNQFDLDTKVHPKACCNAQVPRTGRAHGGRVGYADGGDVMDLGGEGNFLTRLGEMEFSPGTTFGNRLFGTGGEERYQTWPEKMIRSGFTLPGDVAAGKFDTQPSVPGQWSDEDEARRELNQQELLARAQDTAGMAGGAAMPEVVARGVDRNALGVVPVARAKELKVPTGAPNETLTRAADNTPGAYIDPDGHLVMDVSRGQRPEQAGEPSVRGGVFYLPQGSENARYYTGRGPNLTYGGSEKIAGQTAFKNPLVVKGATGGKAPEAAYDSIIGKGAYQEMRTDALRSAGAYYLSRDDKVHLAEQFLQKYAPEMEHLADYIVQNSQKGNQMAYALQEAAVASAARQHGYDGIVGYSLRRGGDKQPFISEVFDVRESHYPTAQGDYEVHPMFFEDAAAPGAPLSALEKAPPFFSAVERAVEAIPQAKMTGDQWLGTLSNKPGVKPEEMEWTGLANFLAERKGQPVTKQEIAEHLGDNQVRLNEVWKGADPEALAKAQALAKEHGWESWDALSPVDRQRYMQRVRGNRLTDQVPGDTRYHQYQLPGGENYREMLLTLPQKEGGFDPSKVSVKRNQQSTTQGSAELFYGDRRIGSFDDPPMLNRETGQYERRPDDYWVEVMRRRYGGDRSLGIKPMDDGSAYRSSHWDEPNIVAHMRMNDRSMALPFTPEETAVIEARRAAQGQLDSIRAQQADVAREINATAKPLRQARRDKIMEDYLSGKVSGPETNKLLDQALYGEDLPELIPLQNRLQELRAQEDQLRASLPPEPKQRQARSLHLEEIQSDWHQQGRDKGYRGEPLQYGSRIEGYTPVGYRWEKGTEPGKHYVVHKLVDPHGNVVSTGMDRVEALKKSGLDPTIPDAPFKKTWHELALKRALREAAEGGYDRLSWTPGDAQAARYDLSKSIDQINYDKKSGYLEAVDKNGVKHIGGVVPEAQLADHIGKEAAEKLLKTEPNDKGVSILRNADLKIGGEGMRGFYDQMIPKSIEKIAKQYGVKAQKGELAAPSLENMSGQQAPSLNAERKAHPVWYIDIPKSLKDHARSKGFALFADSGRAGAPLSALAKQEIDWSPGGGSKTVKLGPTTIDYGISRDGKSGEIILVKTPRAERGQGAARAAMERMVDEADRHGTTLFLNADPMDKGVSRHGLVRFYRSLGFVKNKGRNKDFTSRAAFVRQPKTLLEDSAVFGTPLSAMRWDPLNDPNYKIQAIKKRGQGIPTGKSAKGWDFKRPDPAKGSWDRHVAEVRAAWNNDRSRILNDYLEQTNSMMTPDDWAFMQSDHFRAQGGRVDMAGAPTFDPDKPFDVVEPAFDPTQPFEEVKPDAGAMSAAGRGAYQGATFGFGDELRGIGEAGGVKPDEWNDPISVMKGAYRYWTGEPGAEEAYEAGAKREREANKLAKEQHPYAYMGGEFAGAVPSMMALPGGMAARGATLATRMRQGALVGSEYGALSGAGDGEDAASRAVGAGAGAVAGGAGGALAAPLTEGAGYFLKRTLGPVWNSVVGLTRGSEAEAARRLFTAAEADSADIAAGKMTGLTPAQWQAAKAAGEPVTLADFGGTRVQSLLRSAANTSPEGRGTLEKAFGDRFEGQAERVAQDVRGLVSGGANAHKTADQLVAEYDVARIPAYRKAFAQPGAQGMWDDEFAQMAQAPVVGQAIRMATVNGRNEAAKLGLKPPVNPFQFNKDGTVTLTDPNFTPNLQFWDVVKKNLDKMGADGNAWSKVLRGKLDEAVPEYGQARGIAAQFFGERDALEAGRQLAGKRVDPQVVAGLMRKMSPEEKDLFREGFASDWAGRVIGGFRDSRDITKAMFNSPNEREMARVLFGDAGLRKLQARMTLEAVMDGARKAMGNSTTARQLIEAGLAGGALGGYLDGDWKGAVAGAAGAAGARRALASEMAAGARKLIGKVDSATAARVADLLTSDDPRKLAQGLRIMVSNQKVADGMRALADRLANAGQETGIPRLHIDTTGWGGSLPARADQNQDQPQGLGQQ